MLQADRDSVIDRMAGMIALGWFVVYDDLTRMDETDQMRWARRTPIDGLRKTCCYRIEKVAKSDNRRLMMS